jgi:starvation-inducible DNA-binding protein
MDPQHTNRLMHDKSELAEQLNGLLANIFNLYLASRNFHWNLATPRNQTLHTLFQEHYRELGNVLDEIAGRIRALGNRVAATHEEYHRLATIPEPKTTTTAPEMVCYAGVAHHNTAKVAQSALELAAAIKDVTTADLLSEIIAFHEQCARELGSCLELESALN